MRSDSLGMFWEDVAVVKEVKVKEKRLPPERTWERPDYLPGLQEAIAFANDHSLRLTDSELVALANNNERLFWDIEIYRNYLLISFVHAPSGKYIEFEAFASAEELEAWGESVTSLTPVQINKLKWVFDKFIIVGFNSNSFDCTIASLALAQHSTDTLKQAANMLIVGEDGKGFRPHDVLKHFKCKEYTYNSIDLIEVAPLQASLKIYGGRLHTTRMQDLPFPPETVLSEQQACIVRHYCANDLEQTILLYNCLEEQIKLRIQLSIEYNMDLRSKSDAQMAEAIIAHELRKVMGKRIQRPIVEPGRVYHYEAPFFLRYQTDLMKSVLSAIKSSPFIVGPHGGIIMPPNIAELKIKINNTEYQMGIGGLHSCEKSAAHIAEGEILLRDADVASYYPMIILLCGLFPPHLGQAFLTVFRTLVERRLKAKANGQKVIADSLKIVINGTFGKLASMWSLLYAPNLMLQVTVTGQLSLLMLIERLELAGLAVVSANTDGVVIKCTKAQNELCDQIIKQWEFDTGFEMETTPYKALYSRDINNYMAIKDAGFKGKGAFADPWSDKKNPASVLHKNPSNQICVNAAYQFIANGVPIMETLTTCADIKQFVSVRTVKGGAVKNGEYLGKSVRWYYAREETDCIIYALTGNKVPKTEGAKSIAVLPAKLPEDIDYDWYFAETEKIIGELGYS